MRRFPRTLTPTSPTGGALTPYDEARQLYASFVQQERRHTRAWQWGMGGLGLLALSLGGLLVLQSASSHVTPYVVEVDQLGHVRNLGPAEAAYVPSDAAVAKQLTDFLVATRGLSVDPVVMRQRWDWAFAVVTPRAGQALTTYVTERQPQAKFGTEATSLEVIRTLHPSPTSWDITWRETTVQATHAQPMRSELWTGLFTIVLRQPKTEEELRVNPLGIWIDHFDWQRPAQ